MQITVKVNSSDTPASSKSFCDLRTAEGLCLRCKMLHSSSFCMEIMSREYVKPGSSLQLYINENTIEVCVACCRRALDKESSFEVGLLSIAPQTKVTELLCK